MTDNKVTITLTTGDTEEVHPNTLVLTVKGGDEPYAAIDAATYDWDVHAVFEPTREFWTWMRDVLADDARTSWVDGDDERRATWDHYNYAMDAWLTSREARIHPDDVPERPTEDDPDEALTKVVASAFYAYLDFADIARAAREHIAEEGVNAVEDGPTDITEEPPVGSQVTDFMGDVWERREEGWVLWWSERSGWVADLYEGELDPWASLHDYAPLRPATDEDRKRVGLPVDTAPADDGLAEWERELLRPATCCGKCPPIAGGGYDCTCVGNPRCEKADTPEDWHDEPAPADEDPDAITANLMGDHWCAGEGCAYCDSHTSTGQCKYPRTCEIEKTHATGAADVDPDEALAMDLYHDSLLIPPVKEIGPTAWLSERDHEMWLGVARAAREHIGHEVQMGNVLLLADMRDRAEKAEAAMRAEVKDHDATRARAEKAGADLADERDRHNATLIERERLLTALADMTRQRDDLSNRLADSESWEPEVGRLTRERDEWQARHAALQADVDEFQYRHREYPGTWELVDALGRDSKRGERE